MAGLGNSLGTKRFVTINAETVTVITCIVLALFCLSCSKPLLQLQLQLPVVIGANAFEVCGSNSNSGGDDGNSGDSVRGGGGDGDGDGDGDSWLSRNVNNSNINIDIDINYMYCPSGNTCCRMPVQVHGVVQSWGCVASDMGARNATCCSDGNTGAGTGCPSGYECRRRRRRRSRRSDVEREGKDQQFPAMLYDCVRSSRTSSSEDNDPLMEVLPRYRLCLAEESNRKLYGMKVPTPLPSPTTMPMPMPRSESFPAVTADATTAAGKIAYYSNLGPIADGNQKLSAVELVLVIVHGANRNGDDYFCSAKATIELQQHQQQHQQQCGCAHPTTTTTSSGTVLVIAPVFLAQPRQKSSDANNTSFLYWNDAGDKDGSWRYGADASGPMEGVSSFDALDAIITALKSNRWLPNLHKIVVAGHSSGGQFVQRWSLLTPPSVWPVAPLRIAMHAIVANPSNYVYFTPLRFDFDKSRRKSASSSWNLPPRDDCPNYNQWEWGLESGGALDVPYRRRAVSRDPEGLSGIIDRYLLDRSVVYLAGNLDRCDERDETKTRGNCNSHGLETTCADELQGKNRYERSARYWASLEIGSSSDQSADESTGAGDRMARTATTAAAAAAAPHGATPHCGIGIGSSFHKHRRIVVPNVGHDHAMMFQSREGIFAIYCFDGTENEQPISTTATAVITSL